MARVDLEGIVKRFGSTEVLSRIALDINDGEFLVLVGPSGCGKSTLLRVIAGLEDADAGVVRIDDRDVTALEPRERDIAMVFQSYALYPHMTVRQNIGFSLKLSGRPEAEIGAAVDDAARLLGLSALLDRKPRELSGGQRQRVAMGRAIVRKPALFLFDEPLSNLDAKLRVQMRTEIRALHERLGATSVYVTHDQVEAMTMADRIVVLDRGRIVQIGTPLEVYGNPANRFVAEFIGAPGINILNGKVDADGTVRAGNIVLGRSAAAPGPVDVGIRPEDLVPGEPGASDALPLTFGIVEHLGAETYVFGDHDGRQICWRRPGSLGRAGETVWLRPEPGRVHLFDKTTGGALPQITGAPSP
ncbi:sn-glycerol-3-phosphate ABC transporter ATP-binding protein UgpC [Sinorhizobium meliloti]|uniref:ABC transporter ATP-binding protein n=1 Tax=Rhizobium meliloti TaxID=382 RepID=UPI000FD74C4C|nr:sn-glycerol-3-phosphate ABC transporter ATP-binding protein UgpC [Sinorhizobium meliloti]MDW9500587.1 sn-glycerol-3-phosphate ABC transporter ATP-binding protein UgpC [Sinorhizobium meliloti]RVL94227.1 sn-glycerol-3-phosphate ABC transporter ATP-binding protein UgpC [Sinorhizobium meliloti]